MATVKDQIVSKASVIIGTGQFTVASDNKVHKVRNLAEAFVSGAIEEIYLSSRWPFGIKAVSNIAVTQDFTETDINDALKVFSITPGIIEWYISNNIIFVRCNENPSIRNIEKIFYYSSTVLDAILKDNSTTQVPNLFIDLCALSVASSIAHAVYGDSQLSDGIRATYARKLAEVSKLHSFENHITNSAGY